MKCTHCKKTRFAYDPASRGYICQNCGAWSSNGGDTDG